MTPPNAGRTAPGRMVQRTLGDIPYLAFMPDPLPPLFDLDMKLAQQLSRADRALGELAGLGRDMPNPHLFIAPFGRREKESLMCCCSYATQVSLA